MLKRIIETHFHLANAGVSFTEQSSSGKYLAIISRALSFTGCCHLPDAVIYRILAFTGLLLLISCFSVGIPAVYSPDIV